MLKKFWQRIKHEIINLLGGYTLEQYKAIVDIMLETKIRLGEEEYRVDNLHRHIKTVTAELRTLDGMSDDDAIRIGKDSICRQLGEAVYPYARHFVCDGIYTATVNVQTCKDGKS